VSQILHFLRQILLKNKTSAISLKLDGMADHSTLPHAS
jgi:hypothetical protein